MHRLRPLRRGLPRAARAELPSLVPVRPRPAADVPDVRVPLPASAPLFVKGMHASALGAVLGGCRHFFGYPITPSTEGAELMSSLLPTLGGTSCRRRARSPPINMMYGCGGAGPALALVHLVAGLQPDAGGDLVPRRRGGPGGGVRT